MSRPAAAVTVRPFRDPDLFHELTFASPLAARRAIAVEIRLPLAKLSDDDRAFDALLTRTLARAEILAAVRDQFLPGRRGGSERCSPKSCSTMAWPIRRSMPAFSRPRRPASRAYRASLAGWIGDLFCGISRPPPDGGPICARIPTSVPPKGTLGGRHNAEENCDGDHLSRNRRLRSSGGDAAERRSSSRELQSDPQSVTIPTRKSGSQEIRRRREMDSNFQFRARRAGVLTGLYRRRPSKVFAFPPKRPVSCTRDRWFESVSLQQTVRLSPASAFERREPRLSARVCAARLATRSAETRTVF
jgi:hypothetical protein